MRTASIGPRWQLRIVHLVADDVQVRVPAEHRPDPEKRQRLAGGDRRRAPDLRRDARRDLQGKIARARAQIHDGIARTEIERSKDVVGTLPRIPLAFDDGQRPQRAHRLIADEDDQHDHKDHHENDDEPSLAHSRSPEPGCQVISTDVTSSHEPSRRDLPHC